MRPYCVLLLALVFLATFSNVVSEDTPTTAQSLTTFTNVGINKRFLRTTQTTGSEDGGNGSGEERFLNLGSISERLHMMKMRRSSLNEIKAGDKIKAAEAAKVVKAEKVAEKAAKKLKTAEAAKVVKAEKAAKKLKTAEAAKVAKAEKAAKKLKAAEAAKVAKAEKAAEKVVAAEAAKVAKTLEKLK
ncbi:hypothetical protein BBI17_009516, partial [Phytophthora kernoviae]